MKIPEIGRLQPDPQHLEITFYLDPDLLWFKGHFAVQPLLPGVAQLDWVMHYAASASSVRRVVSSLPSSTTRQGRSKGARRASTEAIIAPWL